jgi:flagellar secretion chaperone FliS
MNPYAAQSNAYRESSILTASPEQLVVMLYDGAMRFLRQADAAVGQEGWMQAGERLQRAEAIIDELMATLNLDAGEVAVRLQAIYVFCRRSLIEARVERSTVKIGHVQRLLSDLREAWCHVAAQTPAGARAAAPAPSAALAQPTA